MKLLKRIAVQKLYARYYSYFELENLVSQENISRTITNLRTNNVTPSNVKKSFNKAAVLIPLCIVDGKPSLLYTLRTSHLRSHKGQVSFPGGKQDNDDGTLENTALRETQEELGIDPQLIKIWGTGNFLLTRTTYVLPVVGHIISPVDCTKLEINQHEVEEVFSVSLEDLCDPSKYGYTQFKNNYSTPVFLGGRRRIWGLTAVITHMFLKSLLPYDIYSHNVKFIQSYSIITQV